MSYPTSVVEAELLELRAAEEGRRWLDPLLSPPPGADRVLFTTTPTGPSSFFDQFMAQHPPQRPSEGHLDGFYTSHFSQLGSIGPDNDVSRCAPRS